MTVVTIPSDWELIKAIGDVESQEIKSGDIWREDLLTLVREGHKIKGERLPWSKVEHLVRLRPSEISIWAGMNGHFKSMIVGQVMLNLAKDNKVCIASFEMTPLSTIDRMARQAAATEYGEAWANQFCDWMQDRMYIYDQLDTCPPDRVLGMIYYAAKELNCKHIVIDSLAKCGIPEGDSIAEKLFIDRMAWAAKNLGIHIHLIAHVRKPSMQGEEYRPTKFDVRGHGSITDLVDNVFIVWKNKRRAEIKHAMEQGLPVDSKDMEYHDKTCDQVISIAKQRHGAWEGDFALFFDKKSLSFKGTESQRVEHLDLASCN